MSVRVRRDAQLPLPDEAGDLRPRAALPVEERDPAVPKVVRAEHRHARGSASRAIAVRSRSALTPGNSLASASRSSRGPRDASSEPRNHENADSEWRAGSDGVGELHVFCPEYWEPEFGEVDARPLCSEHRGSTPSRGSY